MYTTHKAAWNIANTIDVICTASFAGLVARRQTRLMTTLKTLRAACDDDKECEH